MKICRKWGMPSADTFTCPPIRAFVDFYLRQSKISIDPFARNFTGCTYTNDLNPNTHAQYNMDALDFLKMIRDKGTRPNLIVFDPPYSPRQIKECYDGIGLKMGPLEAFRTNWHHERNLIMELLPKDGIVLSFGWKSDGMGKKRGFSIERILLVCHGSTHNDTICVAERRTSEQIPLFSTNQPLDLT